MKTTKIMAILNVTPDSFYAHSRRQRTEDAIERGLQLALEGADILDIGGESTRPYATPVAEEEELQRVIPVIKGLKQKNLRIPISIDTTKPEVARQALDAGASMINDVSGFTNPAMRRVANKVGCEIFVMHMLGTPVNMQEKPAYERGVIQELTEWFQMQTKTLLHDGIAQDKIVLDPGIGFGKTVEDNIEILRHIDTFRSLGFKVLVGVSRKSFMAKLLSLPTEELLYATLAVDIMLMLSQVEYLRVHDVKAHYDALQMVQTIWKKK